MKTRSTFLLLAVIIMSAGFIQAHNPFASQAGSNRTPSMRQLVNQHQRLAVKPNLVNEPIQYYRQFKTHNPESVIFQSPGDISRWKNDLKAAYTYENGKIEKQAVYHEYNETGNLIPSKKEVMIYNTENVLQEKHIYNWCETGKNGWQLLEKELTLTDDYGNLIMEAFLQWNNSTVLWDTIWATSIHYSYSKSGTIEERTAYNYDSWNEKWVPMFRELFRYDSHNEGLLTEVSWLEWDSIFNVFRETNLEYYFYDGQGQWSEVYMYGWNENEWQLEAKAGSFKWYDFSNLKPILFTVYSHDGHNGLRWQPFLKAEFEYDNRNKKQTLLQLNAFEDAAREWIPLFREINSYDENLFPEYYLVEIYEGKWVLAEGLRNNIQLDEKHDPKAVIVELFDGNQWNYMVRMLFDYEKERIDSKSDFFTEPVTLASSYTNPVMNQLTLVMENEVKDVLVEIYNTSGQLVLRRKFFNAPNSTLNMDMGNLHTGMYIVNLNAETQMQTIKVFKN